MRGSTVPIRQLTLSLIARMFDHIVMYSMVHVHCKSCLFDLRFLQQIFHDIIEARTREIQLSLGIPMEREEGERGNDSSRSEGTSNFIFPIHMPYIGSYLIVHVHTHGTSVLLE